MTSVSYSAAPPSAERIGLLVERRSMLLAARPVADHDARQAVVALQPDEVAAKAISTGSGGPGVATTSFQLSLPGAVSRGVDDA